MKAIIIARVSTDEQKEAGNSLPAQTTRMEKYCEKRKGLTIDKSFSFDESAYKDKRKGFDEILDYILNQKEKVAVCFDKVDRLSRNVFDKRVSLLYEKALNDEIELHFVSDGQVIDNKMSAVEKFQFGISLGLAKYYSDAISDNVKRAIEQKLRRGEWPGKAPYGYINIDRENGSKWVVTQPNEAQIVKKMYEWYGTSSYSMNEVRSELKKVFGIDFSKGKVDHILKNPFYWGEMRYDGNLYPHKYDPVITEELFNRVQAIKAGYSKKHFKFAGLPFFYRGLIRCAECGCMVSPERKKGKYIYYHCTQYHGNHGAKWLREEDLTAQFAKIFSSVQVPQNVVEDITEALRKNHEDKSNFHTDLLKQYQKEYQKCESRIEKMYEDKLDGSITESFYEKKRKEYRLKQSDLEGRIENLRFTDENYYLTASYVLNLASKAREIFESSELHERRQLLKMVLQNLTLRGKNIEYDWVKPFDVICNYASRQAWLRGLDSNQ